MKIYPKQEKKLYIDEEFDYELKEFNAWYIGNAFEYILFNENDEIVFKGTSTDYFEDKIYLD